MIHIEEAAKFIDEAIEEAFVKAHLVAGSTSGDITPHQVGLLDELKESLSRLLFTQVNQNCENPVFKDSIYTRRPQFLAKQLAYVNERCKVKMQNVSYKNDALDSIGTEFVSIYLPNSGVTDIDQERFSSFSIRVDEDSDHPVVKNLNLGAKEFSTIEEVVDMVNLLVDNGVWSKYLES